MERLQGSDWLPIEKGRQNTMLMRLARKEADPMQFNNYQFDLRTEDDHHETLRINDFIEDMKAQQRFNDIKMNLEKAFKPLKKKRSKNHFVVSGTWCLNRSAKKKNSYSMKSSMPVIINPNGNQWFGKSMLGVAMFPENVNDLVQRSAALDLKIGGTSTQLTAEPSCSSLMRKNLMKCG